ncbi:MAG: hypothetical protein JSR82_19985 [Verrucomicrobia bacterium]|nr:hypothetical protein [Verrucomicrobiota bacterium]
MRSSLCAAFAALAFGLVQPASAISVSGRVSTTDGSSPAGYRITVEQVGGELPIFQTDTAADGTFSVFDPLLFGNIRIKAARAGYQVSPSQIDRFTSSNITDANFTAVPLAPDLTVLAPGGANLASGSTFTLPPEFPGYTRALVFTLRNDGLSPLTGLAASFAGPQATDFALLNPPPATLAAGASASLTVLWMPSADGPTAATLQLTSNDPDEATFSVQLAGDVLPLALLTVSTTADTGPGSLRAAVAQAAALGGSRQILFAPALNGASLTIQSQLTVGPGLDLTLDASTLPAGLTLRGTLLFGEVIGTRHFLVSPGGRLQLTGLTLTAAGGSGDTLGGSIRNEGQLTLTRCTLLSNRCLVTGLQTAGGAIANIGQLQMSLCRVIGNISNFGAGIFNSGVAQLTDCSVDSNGSTFTTAGGGINSSGTLTLTRCSVSDNVSRDAGGGIVASGSVTLTHCTVDSNRAFLGDSGGGGIEFVSGTLALEHCTITNNVADFGGGLLQVGDGSIAFARLDRCIVHGNKRRNDFVSDFSGGPFFANSPNLVGQSIGNVSGIAPILADPLLAPLDNYGGPTRTRATRPGSPARGAALGSSAVTDQRGFPIVGTADLGAYEAGTLAPNFNAYIWETLPVSASVAEHAAGFDFDGDGQSNQDEWLAQTDAASARSFFLVTAREQAGQLAIEFASALGRTYRLEQSSDLANAPFLPVAEVAALSGTGAMMSFSRPLGGPRAFYRVVVGP